MSNASDDNYCPDIKIEDLLKINNSTLIFSSYFSSIIGFFAKREIFNAKSFD